MRQRVNRWVVLAVALAAASTITACRSSGVNVGSGQPDAIKPAAVKAEYLHEQDNLTLAPGWAWPKDPTPRSVADDGSNFVYQRGYGVTAADHYWYCSWESAFVRASTPAARDGAFKILTKVKQTHYYKADLLPPDRGRFDKILTDAGLGDLAGMQFDVDNNCPPGPS